MTINSRCRLTGATLGVTLFPAFLLAAWLGQVGIDKAPRTAIAGVAWLAVCLLVLRLTR